MSGERRVARALHLHLWCVGRYGWWQQWQQPWEYGRHTSFAPYVSRTGARCERTWRLGMSDAEQHGDSVVTRQPTSLNLNNAFFSNVCDYSLSFA